MDVFLQKKTMWICPDHSLLSALLWHLVSPPAAAALQLTRQQETVSYVCCLQLFALKWNLAIMSSSIWWEILDFIHARAEQLRWKENVRQSKDIGRGPQPSTKPSRPPRRISQMFPLTGYPYVRNLQQRNIITFSSRNILSSKSRCFMLLPPLCCGQGF